jgi:SAM-dependent methyltransferase
VHSLRNSISKRFYTSRLTSKKCSEEWQGQYWKDVDGIRVVSCESCRKFDAKKLKCSVPFGSQLRKCVTAAQEANLNSLSGMNLLEIGFGKHSIPQRLVTNAGGTWTGIEPKLPVSKKAEIGKGGFGSVENIPFADATFDFITGIQSIEHWAERLPDPSHDKGHAAAIREIHRVLKPGGSIYFCAPIHLHGHEMFVAGDIERIRSLFDPLPWSNVVIERWRENYSPLGRYRTPDGDSNAWANSVKNYSRELLQDILENRSVSLITIKADKAA